MAEIIIYDYSDYRAYMEAELKSPAHGRGGKAKVAQHLGCQPSFVSQVLKGKSSFSLEQGFKLNSFFQHNPLQKEFFMVLIELDRAGTFELQKYFEGKRLELIEKSKLIENQMSYDQLSDIDVVSYYNNWNNIVIRNLIDIPAYKTLKGLKKKMSLPDEEFHEAFDFLKEKELIKENEDGSLEQGHVRLHVKKQSPLARYGYVTSRLQMIKNHDKFDPNSLKYVSNMTLPKSSFEEFKKRLVALIVELNSHLEEESQAEVMATLVVDFMEV